METDENLRHDQISVKSAVAVARLLWPAFVRKHGCIFLAQHADSNPPPANDTATGWESFVNHTHIFDEFANEATRTAACTEESGDLVVQEMTYDDLHPDFVRACELGQTAARLWAFKLKLEFPYERFRVYYTQYDNPIIRFHVVRKSEPFWLSDETLRTATHRSFWNALVYDTGLVTGPSRGPSKSGGFQA